MLASTGDGGGSNTRWRYILTCLLGSFLNYIRDFTSEQSLIISWTFRILAHEEFLTNTLLWLENIKPTFCLKYSNRLKPSLELTFLFYIILMIHTLVCIILMIHVYVILYHIDDTYVILYYINDTYVILYYIDDTHVVLYYINDTYIRDIHAFCIILMIHMSFFIILMMMTHWWHRCHFIFVWLRIFRKKKKL